MIEGTPGTAFEGEVTVRRIRFAGEDGGFAVLDAERDGDELVLVGPIAHLEERERARIRGTWQDDRRFGMQIRVATAEPLAPSGDAALLAYLKRVKHVGDGRAKQLLARHGPDVLEAIDADPHGALRAVGLEPEAHERGGPLLARAAVEPRAAPPARAARARLARPADHQGARRARASRRPRAPVRADQRVRRRVPDRRRDRPRGRDRADAPARTRAAVVHVLAEAERDGSTCLPVAELATRAAALLDGPPPDAALLGAMADDGQLVVEVDDEAWAYRPATWALEAELAQRIGELAAAKAVLKPPGTVRDEPTSSRRPSRPPRWPRRSRTGSPSSPAARAPARPPRSACSSPPPRPRRPRSRSSRRPAAPPAG